MANRYFFDKRDMKRGGLKYLIIFAIAFVPTILFNLFVGKYIEQRWLIILLDCVIILLFVAVGNYLASRIYSKKERELEAKIKYREEIAERKRQILADSYNLKRIEKQRAKQEKLKQVEKKEVKEDSINIDSSNVEKDIKIDNINTETIKGNSGKSTTIKSKNTKSKDKK